MALYSSVDLVAECAALGVEDDGNVGRENAFAGGVALLQQFPQHVAETRHGADGQAVRLARQRRKRVIGAKDIGGAIDQKHMVVRPDIAWIGGFGGVCLGAHGSAL